MLKITSPHIDVLKKAHLEYCTFFIKKRASLIKDNNNSLHVEEEAFYERLSNPKDSDDLIGNISIGNPKILKKTYEGINRYIEKCMSLNNQSMITDQDRIDFNNTFQSQNIDVASLEKVVENVIKRLKKVFNYPEFRNRKTQSKSIKDLGKGNWSAYNLTHYIGCRVCCYCNRQYTITLDGFFRPTLDHFYPQSMYPIFAISFYNLIPSCTTCNSSLKQTKDPFSTIDLLHPYFDEIHDEMKFKLAKEKDFFYNILMGKNDLSSFKIELKNKDKCAKSNNSINEFKILEQYNLHKEEILDVFKLFQSYNSSSIRQAAKLFVEAKSKNIKFEDDKIDSLSNIFQNRLKDSFKSYKPSSRSLGKLMNDIIESEFK